MSWWFGEEVTVAEEMEMEVVMEVEEEEKEKVAEGVLRLWVADRLGIT